MNMKTGKKSIEAFLASKTMAVAGVSRDPKKFGHTVLVEMTRRGYEILPVNPAASEIRGKPCFASVSALPEGIRSLLVVTPKDQTLGVVREAVAMGIGNIWIQQMSQTPEALEFLKDKPVNLIARQCILMWTEPVGGMHKFHRSLKRIFGALPS